MGREKERAGKVRDRETFILLKEAVAKDALRKEVRQENVPWVKHVDWERDVSCVFTERHSFGPTRITRRPTLVPSGRSLSPVSVEEDTLWVIFQEFVLRL